MVSLSHIGMTGPLEPYRNGYEKHLFNTGYSVSGAKRHFYLMVHLSRWMQENAVDCDSFNAKAMEHFLSDRRADGYVRFRTTKGLSTLLAFLLKHQVLLEPTQEKTSDPVVVLIFLYCDYLSAKRGLSNGTIVGYKRIAESFLRTCSLLHDGDEWRLEATHVHDFMKSECSSFCAATASNVATALRSLLNFMYTQKLITTALADTVLRAPTWRDPGLSKAISDHHVKALISSCDRRTKAGRRDFAILSLLSRLGLRSVEVASITLDSIDWRNGEITFIGKHQRCEKLPLPCEVGKAMAEYSQYARRKSACRTFFLAGRAPYNALSASSVSYVVLRASQRAGIAPVTAHQLRHSVATAMRRANIPLFEISLVLRHQHATTTAIYAKEDISALTGIARLWSGASS